MQDAAYAGLRGQRVGRRSMGPRHRRSGNSALLNQRPYRPQQRAAVRVTRLSTASTLPLPPLRGGLTAASGWVSGVAAALGGAARSGAALAGRLFRRVPRALLALPAAAAIVIAVVVKFVVPAVAEVGSTAEGAALRQTLAANLATLSSAASAAAAPPAATGQPGATAPPASTAPAAAAQPAPGTPAAAPGAERPSATGLSGSAPGQLFVQPASGRVTSGYGYRSDPFTGLRKFHNGIDIANQAGTPIVAAMSGTVDTAGYNGNYGRYLILRHADGFQTLYAHLNKVLVAAGDRVLRGQRVGEMGNTGYSSAVNLHFSIFHNGAHVDPSEHLE